MKNNNKPATSQQETASFVRGEKRYNHIYITMQVKVGYEWIPIKALDWNRNGFNFSLEQEMPYSNALFKKGHTKFRGKIVWKIQNDDKMVTEMALNSLLFDQLQKVAETDIAGRIAKLIRSNGRLEEKKKLLALLNPQISDNDISGLTERYNKEHHLYRYGIKVESKDWTDIVEQTLNYSSAILTMEEIGKEISKIADTIERIE
jgi:hypothetical protein